MKQVIILEKDESSPQVRFRFALWAVVPAARQSFYVNAALTSAFKSASGAEIAALQAGQVVERVDTVSFAAGTSIAVIQAALQSTWTDYQLAISAANPWVRYGTVWDGTSWAAGGVV